MSTVVRQIAELDFAGAVQVETLPMSLRPNDQEPIYSRLSRQIRFLTQLGGKIRLRRPRIVHLHTCSGFSFYRSAFDLWIAQRLGCKVILHVHGAAFDAFHDRAGWCQRFVIRRVLERADRVIALSVRWQREITRISPRATVVVIENAVAIPSYLPVRKTSSSLRLLQLAKMDHWKGVDDLLAACASLTRDGISVELVLAGPSGSAGDEKSLAQKIKAHDLERVARYVGPVVGDEKQKWLHWADVYVQPSHHEGMPIAMLEAMAAGLPIVATSVGAVPEVVTDGVDGLLVPARKPAELATAIRTMADQPPLREAMSLAARAKVRHRFSLARFQNDLTCLYRELESDDYSIAANGRML